MFVFIYVSGFHTRTVTIWNCVSVLTFPGVERPLEGPSILLLSWTTGERQSVEFSDQCWFGWRMKLMTGVCSSVFHWQATIIGPVSLDWNIASGCPDNGVLWWSLFVQREGTDWYSLSQCSSAAGWNNGKRGKTTLSYFRQSRANRKYNRWCSNNFTLVQQTFTSVSDWQPVSGGDFLSLCPFSHRLSFQTTKGDVLVFKEGATRTLFQIINQYEIKQAVYVGCLYNQNLSPKHQQQREHLPWHPEDTVVARSHNIQRWFLSEYGPLQQDNSNTLCDRPSVPVILNNCTRGTFWSSFTVCSVIIKDFSERADVNHE